MSEHTVKKIKDSVFNLKKDINKILAAGKQSENGFTIIFPICGTKGTSTERSMSKKSIRKADFC